MYSYITEELPKALFASFEQLDSSRVSITGHSMGGHGALTLVRIQSPVDPKRAISWAMADVSRSVSVP